MRHNSRLAMRLERLEAREVPTLGLAGSEFQISVSTTGTQTEPAVACDADGDFVVVWTHPNADGDGRTVLMRRFGRDGAALGGEVQVNVFTTDEQHAADVAMDADGDFVVVWYSSTQDGDGGGIHARQFTAAGIGGPEFRVNLNPLGFQTSPAVAMDGFGGFVVTWASRLSGMSDDVFARTYAGNGQPRGLEFRVNAYTTSSQTRPTVAMNAAGEFVIAWSSSEQDGSSGGVYAQRFTRSGVAQGGEFRINAATTGSQSLPSAGIDGAGNLVIAWQATITSGDDDLYYRRFDANGVALSPNDSTLAVIGGSDEESPDIGHGARDTFIVGYTSNAESGLGANYQAYALPGNDSGALGARLQGTTRSIRSTAAVAMDAAGNAVMVWSDNGLDGGDDILAQRYAESADTMGPWVTGVFVPSGADAVDEGERIGSPVSSITVAFSENMTAFGGPTGFVSVTNPANWQITRNGAVVSAISSIIYGFNSANRRYQASLNFSGPLQPGDYALSTGTFLRDEAANNVDGNMDGLPGGIFTRRFRVAQPVAVGPESAVSSSATGIQEDPRIGFDSAGASVVVWRSNEVGPNNFDVYARRFTNAGVPIGNAFRVNDFTTGAQSAPAVAVAATGEFTVVWTSPGQDPDGSSAVYARRYSGAGIALGGEFRVNTFTTGTQRNPAIATDQAGNFVITWESANQDGSAEGIYAQLYSANGAANGAEFRVNSSAANAQRHPSVAMEPDGDFVVAWSSALQDGSDSGVFARRFDVDGTPRDNADLPINTFTTGSQSNPAVALDSNGTFVVAWDSLGQDGPSYGVYARRISVNGIALGGEFRVNASPTNQQFDPAVAVDSDGDFVVAWVSDHPGQYDLYARRYDSTGGAIGGEFRVNTITNGSQTAAAVAMTAAGDFTVVWTSGGSGSPSPSLQRYAEAPVVAPTVVGVQVNGGAAQRSRVTSLTVTFSAQVTFAGSVGGAFTFSRSGGGSVTGAASASVVGGVTVVTLNGFMGSETENGSLRDGRYTLTVLGSQISVGGANMASNFTFGDAQGLFRFFGDMNGDRRVDISDFGFFSLAFLQTANYNAALDFNGDGRIDIADFGQFSVRFFTTLP